MLKLSSFLCVDYATDRVKRTCYIPWIAAQFDFVRAINKQFTFTEKRLVGRSTTMRGSKKLRDCMI